MAKEREIAFVLKATDDASAVLKKVQKVIDGGTKDIQAAFNAATGATDSFQKSMGKVNDWVKENRKEQRMYAGVLSEVRDVVGASGIALAAFGMAAGGAEGATKQLSAALNQGYAAFQGLDAIIGMVGIGGGPWGLAIAAIGGIAAAIMAMGASSEESTEKLADLNVQIAENAVKLGDMTKAEFENVLVGELAKAIRKQQELSQTTTSTAGVIKNFFAMMFGGSPTAAVVEAVGTPEDIANATKAIQDIQLKIKGLYDDQLAGSTSQYYTVQKLAVSTTRFISEEEQKRYDAQIAFHELLSADETTRRMMVERNSDAMLKKITANLKLMKVEAFDSGKALAESTATFMTENANLVHSIYGSLTASVRDMWEDVFTGTEAVAKKLFKSILLSVIDLAQGLLMAALVVAQAKGILTFFATIAADLALLATATVGLQLLRAFVSTQFHSGGVVPRNGGSYFDASPSKEFPILVRGGETVRTEAQEAALQTGGGTTVIVNINAPVDRVEWVKEAVEEGLRSVGLKSADRYFQSNRGTIALGTA
jgi:hypothetical protein